jgi:DNA-binding NtrC family response regulator
MITRTASPYQEAWHARAGSPWERALHERWSLKRLEDEYIRVVLQLTGGNRNQAARILGIDRRTLYRKINRLEAGEAETAVHHH